MVEEPIGVVGVAAKTDWLVGVVGVTVDVDWLIGVVGVAEKTDWLIKVVGVTVEVVVLNRLEVVVDDGVPEANTLLFGIVDEKLETVSTVVPGETPTTVGVVERTVTRGGFVEVGGVAEGCVTTAAEDVVLTPTGYEAFTICTNGFIGFVPALLCC
jgi:hypothetical protein